MAQTHTGARERQDCTAIWPLRNKGFPQPTAGAENGPNPHRSERAPGLHCHIWPARNKGFRSQRLEQRMGQTHTGARERQDCTAIWPVRNKGFRSQRLEQRMAQTHTGARERQDCTAIWPVRNKGFRSQRLEQRMAQTHTGARERQDCTAIWPVRNKGFRSQRLEQRMAQTHTGARERQDCTAIWPVRNKGFRSQRLEQRMAQTHTGARERQDCTATFGRCGIKASAANGWSREWPKPTQERESARTALPIWPVRNKGFRSQRLEQRMAQTHTGARERQDCTATFGRCGIKASAANGWSGEWPKPTHERESARTALPHLAGAE